MSVLSVWSISSVEFRQIESRRAEPAPGENVFRAAISAFCSLTRPTRRELAQLDDLALPLVDGVSAEARRYAAAALSECEHAPHQLVRRLAGDAPDIAAPLLMRSKVLRDVDLISLIANCGIAHARAIARRSDLIKPIHDLLTALNDPEVNRLREIALGVHESQQGPARGELAAQARQKLRTMMRPAETKTYHQGLRDSALSGRPGLFQTALADALGLEFATVKRITEDERLTDFAIALKALDASEELAFLLVSALRPDAFTETEDIRWFLSRYEALVEDRARETIRRWKVSDNAIRPVQAEAS
ncbi:MAG: DUF2336 domain-containing protein [Rhizobiaceae bacterium]